MTRRILFAVGSALTTEYEESCARRGLEIAAWVQNRPGEVFCAAPDRLVAAAALGTDLLSIPFLCPLFTPRNRRTATAEAQAFGLMQAPALIDPSAIMAARTPVGDGSFINASVTIGAAARIGSHVVVNRSASIGHHARIDDFASIGPGAVLAGQVHIGEGAMLGAGCVLLPKIDIGAGAVVGAGSVVTRNVPPGALVYGNPARIIDRGRTEGLCG